MCLSKKLPESFNQALSEKIKDQFLKQFGSLTAGLPEAITEEIRQIIQDENNCWRFLKAFFELNSLTHLNHYLDLCKQEAFFEIT